MKRFAWLWVTAIGLAVLFAGPALATKWTLLQQGEDDFELYNMHVVDENNLFFSSNNTITESAFDLGTLEWVYYSSDGGANLEARYFLDVTFADIFKTSTMFKDIYMSSPTQGYAVGLNFEGLSSAGPMVWATLDGGYTWEKRDTFPVGLTKAYPINKIDFMSPTKGFAFATSKMSFTTDDAGATWVAMPELPSKYASPISLDPGNELRDVEFDGDGGMYVSAAYEWFDDDDDDFEDDKDEALEEGEDGELFFSGDNGLTFTQIYDYEAAGYDQGGFPHLHFVDADHGWMTVIGTKGSALSTDILYTTDSAATWTAATLPTSTEVGAPGEYVIYDVFMHNLERGWAVGYNAFTLQTAVLLTTDGGVTWEFDDYSGLGDVRVIEMLSHRRGWAIGGHMTIISFFNDENLPPVADAGPDRSVNTGATVNLDGSGSYDPDGDAISYMWELTGGPTVILDDPTLVTPTFTTGSDPICYEFELIVTDELEAVSEPDAVVIISGGADCSNLTDDDDDATTDDDDDDDDSVDDGGGDGDNDDDDEGGCCG